MFTALILCETSLLMRSKVISSISQCNADECSEGTTRFSTIEIIILTLPVVSKNYNDYIQSTAIQKSLF